MKKKLANLPLDALLKTARSAGQNAAIKAVSAGRCVAGWKDGRLVEFSTMTPRGRTNDGDDVHIRIDEVQHAATGARTALVVLRRELSPPQVDTAKALGIVERLVDEADAGRDPLLLKDDWPERVLWPARPHWDCWAWAIKTLATACGARSKSRARDDGAHLFIGRLPGHTFGGNQPRENSIRKRLYSRHQ